MTTETTIQESYEVPAENINELRKKLDRMVRKAQKMGLDQISYEIGEGYEVPYAAVYERGFDGEEHIRYDRLNNAEEIQKYLVRARLVIRTYHKVTCAGPIPRLADWEFAATLDHLQDDEGKYTNILRTCPSFEKAIPESFRSADPLNCDHCHTRRFRKDTYVVHNVKTDEWKQVGSTCLQDFCGGKSPEAVVMSLTWLQECERLCGGEGGWDTGGKMDGYGILDFLAVVAAITREEGFVTRKEALAGCRSSTADIAMITLDKAMNEK